MYYDEQKKLLFFALRGAPLRAALRGTPLRAALRARAPFKVSVTQAIEAIKRFNAANGTASKQVTEKPKETIASLTKRVQALENTVEKLLETIQQLSEK